MFPETVNLLCKLLFHPLYYILYCHISVFKYILYTNINWWYETVIFGLYQSVYIWICTSNLFIPNCLPNINSHALFIVLLYCFMKSVVSCHIHVLI